MAKRRYTDVQKAEALAALAANDGDLSKTARQVDVPRKTLADWASGEHGEPPAELRQEKKRDLAGMFENFVEKSLDLTTDDDIRQAPLHQRMIAVGIATDKALLLRGQSGQTVNNLTVVILPEKTIAETHRASNGTAPVPLQLG